MVRAVPRTAAEVERENMELPKGLFLLCACPDDYALALETLRARGVSTRTVEGPFRLAVEFSAAPTEVVVIDAERFGQGLLELMHVLRDRSPNVGLVVISASEQRELAGSALCRGADIVLTKPISSAEVLEAVERAYRRWRLATAEVNGAVRSETLAKFAMGVAHEINNPLTTVSGWLQMLMADHGEDARLNMMLRSMHEETQRIANVVRQLLVVAQQGPPRQDRVNVGQMLREIDRLYRVKLEGGEIELVSDVASDVPFVRGDAAQLRQACETILTENIAACNGRGRIELSCRRKEGGVEISFRDNGPPIAPADLPHLFEPFQFGRNSHGTGLGLCLSRGVVRSHGGTLTVESSEKTGTRFVIWLPAEESRQD